LLDLATDDNQTECIISVVNAILLISTSEEITLWRVDYILVTAMDTMWTESVYHATGKCAHICSEKLPTPTHTV